MRGFFICIEVFVVLVKKLLVEIVFFLGLKNAWTLCIVFHLSAARLQFRLNLDSTILNGACFCGVSYKSVKE